MTDIDFESLRQETEETYGESREEFIARMISQGFSVKYPASSELFIDIDNEQQLATFQANIKVLDQEFGASYIITPSKSQTPGRYHAVVTMKLDVTSIERIALQAALGSDPLRELLSIFRIKRGIEPATIFIENGEANES